jgi:ubiquinone/menaquinone biosynthesis C-methylase UbiE
MDRCSRLAGRTKSHCNFEVANTTEKKTDDIEHFNHWSMTYENSWGQWLLFDRLQRHVLNMAAEKANTPNTVLDVGCGTGRLLRKARKYWPETQLIGVDPADGMIENARRLTPDAKFYVSQAESLPLPDESVNLAFSTASFHHWQDPEKGLSEIKRVLQVGGLLFLADFWLPLGLSKLIRYFQTNDPSAIRETFRRVGFRVQDQRKLWTLWQAVTVGERS